MPFDDSTLNNLEVFNEVCISAMAYTLLILTEFIEDFSGDLKEIGGYIVIGIITLNFIVNISIILKGMIRKIALAVKNYKVSYAKIKLLL